mmetsp:Transcript_56727/g.106499  ORF Transcript_56727/g.106499 Transcript_56727/m.106499 type:complete len:219 (+) Transcript_56727:476-1132(+)
MSSSPAAASRSPTPWSWPWRLRAWTTALRSPSCALPRGALSGAACLPSASTRGGALPPAWPGNWQWSRRRPSFASAPAPARSSAAAPPLLNATTGPPPASLLLPSPSPPLQRERPNTRLQCQKRGGDSCLIRCLERGRRVLPRTKSTPLRAGNRLLPELPARPVCPLHNPEPPQLPESRCCVGGKVFVWLLFLLRQPPRCRQHQPRGRRMMTVAALVR